MAEKARIVTGGIDTHKDTHTAAVIDVTGGVLGVEEFPANASGYADILSWMCSFGSLASVGVEGTGSYGAGVCRLLVSEDIPVLEVIACDRTERRRRGKCDAIDALQAARSALSGVRCTPAKSRTDDIEALRALEATYASAVKARTAAQNALQAQVVSLPEKMRNPLRNLNTQALVRTCAAMRPGPSASAEASLRIALRSLARRILSLTQEALSLEKRIDAITSALVPSMRALKGIGPHVSARLLLTAGSNPQRLGSEASFSMLCGASPVPVASGKTSRYRLSRAGDRQANSALYTIALSRMRHDERTRAYVTKRMAEGKTKKEVIRCLKRYIAREVYSLLVRDMRASGLIQDTPLTP